MSNRTTEEIKVEGLRLELRVAHLQLTEAKRRIREFVKVRKRVTRNRVLEAKIESLHHDATHETA